MKFYFKYFLIGITIFADLCAIYAKPMPPAPMFRPPPPPGISIDQSLPLLFITALIFALYKFFLKNKA